MAALRRNEYHEDGRERRSRSFGRSGGATVLVIALLLLGFGLLWHAHQRAKFHQLTTPVIPQTTSAPMPGGQEAILLSRVALVDDSEPEFVSTTVLPGIGMQVLQVTVAVPDLPVQDLLSSVSLSDAARMPPGSVNSAPFHMRVSTHHLPERSSGDDIVNFTPATDAQNQTLVDGGQASGTFHSANATAGVSATIEVTLSGRQIDLIARAANKSQESRFIAFEWWPRFAAPGGDLNHLTLSVPSRGAGESGGNATGFATEAGRSLGNQPLDLRFAHLGREFLSDGTFVQLGNDNHFLLRLIGLGDSLRSVRVLSDPAAHSVLLGLSSLDSSADTEQHDQSLRPGQTTQWHLRMEVLPVKTPQNSEMTH